MRMVNGLFGNEEAILVNEVQKGICISECDDIVVDGTTIEVVAHLLEEYNSDDDLNSEISFTDYLEDNELDWLYVYDGYYTEEEFMEDYEGRILVNRMMDDVCDAKSYYEWWEEVYFYEYWDGHNWITLDLKDEGEEVIFIKELEHNSTYSIDLYRNEETGETYNVYNSFYEGVLPIVEAEGGK